MSLLERLAVPASEIAALHAKLRSEVREALVLSTCNRTEIYALSGHAASGTDLLLRFLADRAEMSVDSLRSYAYAHADENAVRHALMVASGLDSMVLGEDQIQAQWKRALSQARTAGSLGAMFERLGASALSCGKRVRTFTGIGRHSVSLESLAVRAVVERLPHGIDGAEVLVIGAGESAALIVRHLQASGRPRVSVLSRSLERAEALARVANVAAESVDRLASAVSRADAIFCCTAAPHPVLCVAHFADRLSRDASRPLVCVDLGMPRDVEESVAELDVVSLVTMTELAKLADRHREQRREHLPAAETIVATEAVRFNEWKAARGSSASIARLQRYAGRIADEELATALARLSTLPTREREIVASLARRIVKRLMHAPSTRLKSHPEAENLALALELAFGLSGANEILYDSLPPQTAQAADAYVDANQDIA